MDGMTRIKWCVLSAALAAAVGCSSQRQAVPSVVGSPANPSFLSRLTQPKPPGPTPQVIQAASDNKKPLKPETIVAFADAQVATLFDVMPEEVPGPERDRMVEEARAKYFRVLERDPNNREAMLGVARLYTRLGDRDRAATSYEGVLKAFPNDHKIAYEAALSHARFEDWPRAVAGCQSALAGDPENKRYMKSLAVCTARNGDLETAFGQLQKVMPEAEARFTMAKVLMDTDRAEWAKQQLQLSVQADPNFAPAREWLGQLTGTDAVQQVGYTSAAPTRPAPVRQAPASN